MVDSVDLSDFGTCYSCKKTKHVGDFVNYTKLRRCRECSRLYMKKWADNNREKINKNQKIYHSTVKGRATVLLNAALKRARSRGETFALELSDVIAGLSVGFCCKTLYPFDLELRSRGTNVYKINPMSPSIDKINPSGIYEPSNVQYVCSWYNLAKGQMSEDDLIKFCKRVASLSK